MKYLAKKLLVALAATALAGSGVAAVAALPASADATVQRGALFDGFGKGLDEDVALANAEIAARQNAANHGFTECSVFESVVSQDAKTLVFFAIVAVRCLDVS
ncbi:hypothetical protein GCM10022419_031570 [Nonomuraea rosea]|jgi:hypothetical protein|uniref:DUF732 domain-containing protein n=1 Tax=Nonomuraea rosea TaxID=638574 RepID=A0ABP6WF76_9ACTN